MVKGVFSVFPSLSSPKEVSTEAPKEDLWPKPQIKRPKNECAWIKSANTGKSVTG